MDLDIDQIPNFIIKGIICFIFIVTILFGGDFILKRCVEPLIPQIIIEHGQRLTRLETIMYSNK
jgi:hypothetical protein